MRSHWCMVGCLGLLLACRFPELPPLEEDAPVRYQVGGTVAGLWTGASLQLRLTSSGEQLDTLSIAQEGGFEFSSQIDVNTTVDVEVALEPDHHDCSATNGARRLVTADIADIEIRCTTEIAVDVQIHAPLAFEFDGQVTRHSLDVSVLQTELTLVVTAPTNAVVQVAGRPAATGIAAPAVTLPFGPSEVPVDVALDGLSRRYVVEVDRGASAIDEYRYLKASSAEAGDGYGEAIAGNSEYIVVGAPGDDSLDNAFSFAGAVYVYRRSGSSWIQDGYFYAPPAANNRILGASVAMDGDLIVGGAHGSGIAGAAHVFRRQGGSWLQPQRVTAPLPSNGDSFGFSVATSGGKIAVSDTGANAVYVYALDGVSWTLEATVTSPDSVAGDQFGHRIAWVGDRLAVAAPGESSGATGVMTMPATGTGAPGSGAVYLFRRDGANWTLEAFLKASTPVVDGRFGNDIALATEDIAIGSSSREDVHVFRRTEGTWSQEAVIHPPGASLGFGVALDLRHDLLAIAEPSALLVRLFRRTGGAWIAAGELTASNADPGDMFGNALALLGDGLACGAVNEASSAGGAPGDNAAPFAGAAYVFR